MFNISNNVENSEYLPDMAGTDKGHWTLFVHKLLSRQLHINLKFCEIFQNNEPKTDPVTLMHLNNAKIYQFDVIISGFNKSFQVKYYFLFSPHQEVILTITIINAE